MNKLLTAALLLAFSVGAPASADKLTEIEAHKELNRLGTCHQIEMLSGGDRINIHFVNQTVIISKETKGIDKITMANTFGIAMGKTLMSLNQMSKDSGKTVTELAIEVKKGFGCDKKVKVL